jgi:restriction system protein
MARKDESILNLVTSLPWPVGVSLAISAFVFLRFILPLFSSENPFLKHISDLLATISPVIALMFLAAAGVSALRSLKRGRMLENQKDLDTLKQLNWKEFEQLVGEAFRRKGYFVLENPGAGADGGVDLRLRKNGKKVYVQWARRVGVNVIRELYGVMKDKGADEGIVATYGTFTPDARAFAKDKPIQLMGGSSLIQMIRGVQSNQAAHGVKQESKICPACGSEMVVRVAKKGKHVGQRFWGCSSFPECRTILEFVEEGPGHF